MAIAASARQATAKQLHTDIQRDAIKGGIIIPVAFAPVVNITSDEVDNAFIPLGGRNALPYGRTGCDDTKHGVSSTLEVVQRESAVAFLLITHGHLVGPTAVRADRRDTQGARRRRGAADRVCEHPDHPYADYASQRAARDQRLLAQKC